MIYHDQIEENHLDSTGRAFERVHYSGALDFPMPHFPSQGNNEASSSGTTTILTIPIRFVPPVAPTSSDSSSDDSYNSMSLDESDRDMADDLIEFIVEGPEEEVEVYREEVIQEYPEEDPKEKVVEDELKYFLDDQDDDREEDIEHPFKMVEEISLPGPEVEEFDSDSNWIEFSSTGLPRAFEQSSQLYPFDSLVTPWSDL